MALHVLTGRALYALRQGILTRIDALAQAAVNWFGPVAPDALIDWFEVVDVTVDSEGRYVIPVNKYNWLHSPYGDATGGTSRATIHQWPTTSPSSDGGFLWYVDAANYVGFVVSGANVYLRQRLGNANSQTSFPYDTGRTYTWDIIHDPETDEIVWGQWDNGELTELRRAARTIPITNLRLRFYGGTWGGGSGNFIVSDINPSAAPVTPPPDPDPVPSGETVIVDDYFDRTSTIDYASRSNAAEPFWWPEHDAWPYVISGGTMKRTGNTSFDRLFSKFRFGGPGKTLRFSWRARITTYHPDGSWTGIRGAKVGMKFPSAKSTYAKDDILSVGTIPSPGGGNYTTGQAAGLAPVVGFTETGEYELITLGYDTRNYIGFHAAPGVSPTAAGTWYDKSQEVAWLPNGTLRIRYWENFDLTGTPTYEKILSGEEAFQDAGYLWLRLDYVDTEWDRFRIIEVAS